MHTHTGVPHRYGVFHSGLPDDQYPHHDQIGKATLLDVGGGIAHDVNRSWVAFLSVGRSINGINAHLHAAVITIGLNRSFGERSERGKALARASVQPQPQKALVCTCVKTK